MLLGLSEDCGWEDWGLAGGSQGEAGRVDGMSRGCVLMAGGGLSSKNRSSLCELPQNSQRHKETQNTSKCVCVCACKCVFCACIFQQRTIKDNKIKHM